MPLFLVVYNCLFLFPRGSAAYGQHKMRVRFPLPALPLSVLAQLIADTDGQENLVPYRWHGAFYPVLAPLDDEINI
jgi:hypothetical protein